MKSSGLAATLLVCIVLAGPSPGAGSPTAASSPPVLPDSWHGSIRSVRTAEKVVALTFDLCEGAKETAGYDAGVVAYLRANGVKATFFAGGKWLRSHPEQAGQLLADPLFEIGSHGWSHRNLRQVSGKAMQEEIDLAGEILSALRPKPPIGAAAGPPLFRFPYGTCSSEALAYVNSRGVAAIQWDVVTGDPDHKVSAAAIARTVSGAVHPGAIVIAHANGRGWHTAAALPLFIPRLKAMGYRFVTVGELLAMGEPVTVTECYERKPGDNRRYDRSSQ
ncbi:MAG: polysaccharide deacetylase [Desulfuromonas sp.]|nr:polysaccharide deacetylase [Desulfuromonas sp.]